MNKIEKCNSKNITKLNLHKSRWLFGFFACLFMMTAVFLCFCQATAAFADANVYVAVSDVFIIDGTSPINPTSDPSVNPTTLGSDSASSVLTGDFVGIVLCILALIIAIVAVFVLVLVKKWSKLSKFSDVAKHSINVICFFAIAFSLGVGVFAFSGKALANDTNINPDNTLAQAALANGGESSNGFVPEQMQVVCNKDNGEIKFGEAQYSNIQDFTNISSNYIVLKSIKLTGYEEAGTWVAKDSTGKVVYEGTVEDEIELDNPITLAPSEKATFIWNTKQSADNLLKHANSIVAHINYIYEDAPVPITTAQYKVELWEVDLSGNKVSPTPFDSYYTTGNIGEMTKAQAPDKNGYSTLPIVQKEILADGSTVVEILYEPVNNPVTFVDEDGKEITIEKVKPGEKATSPSAPQKVGYTFDNWYADQEFTTLFDFTQPINTETTVYAKYNSIPYNITYNLDGGAVSAGTNPTSYTINDSVALTNPTKTGYTFAGWTGTDLTGPTIDVSFSGKTGDRQYTATWTANNYHVKFDAQGATGSMANQDFTYDAKQNLTKNSYTKTGYEFKGWGIEGEKTTAKYADEAEVSNLTSEAGAVFTLYAVWSPITYTVKFDGNDATSGTMIDQAFIYDAEQNLSTNAYTQTGYQFDGWATSKGGEKVYDDNAPVKNLSSVKDAVVTLYAHWAPNTDTAYKVCHWKLDKSGTRPSTATDTDNLSGTTGATTAAAVKTYKGYTAKTVTQATIAADGSTVVNIEYVPIKYYVAFDANAGTGTMDKQTFYYDESQNLPDCIFTKSGSVFSGWSSTKTVTTESNLYADKALVSNLSDTNEATVTLYAVWTENYIVNFTDRFGVVTADAQSVAPGGKASKPSSDPTKTGYTFAGWYTDAAAGTTFDFNTAINNNTTVYAHWNPVNYTISYDLQGGTQPTPANPTQYNADTTDFELAAPSKTGYTFKGWTYDEQTEPQLTVKISQGTTGNLSYTANWDAAEVNYTVKHMQQNIEDDNYTEVATDRQTLKGKTGESTNAQAKTYTGFTAQTVTQATIAADSSTVVEIKYDRITYDIKFVVDSNKGTASGTLEQTLKYGATPTKPTVTANAGYILKSEHSGWDKDVTAVTGDATYTARFDLTSYAITYVLNGGTVASSNPTSYTIETETFTLNNPTKTGYNFTGWTWDGQTTPQTTATVDKGSTGNKTFTANWSPQTYSITYRDQNDADFSGTTTGLPTTHTYGKATPLVDTTRAGYVFDGYYEDKECTGTKITSLDATDYTANIILYAKWTKIPKSTITFATDGNGTVSPSSSIVVDDGVTYSVSNTSAKVTVDGNTVTASPNTTGYVFYQWVDENDNPYSTEGTVTKDMTFKATFVKIAITINFDANGGTIGGQSSAQADIFYGDKLTSPAPDTRTDYEFKGWTTEKDDPNTLWDFNTPVTVNNISGNTLYALWDSTTKYTVVFDSQGGTGVASQQVGTGSKVTEPTPPTKSGYVFGGWYKESACTTPWNFASDTVSANSTLYAKWQVKATFDAAGGKMESGEETETLIVDNGSTLTQPTDPTWVDDSGNQVAEFGGWYKDSSRTTPWDFTNDTVTTATTIYAKWLHYATFSVTGPTGKAAEELMTFNGVDVNSQITMQHGATYKFEYDSSEDQYKFTVGDSCVTCDICSGYNYSAVPSLATGTVNSNLEITFVVVEKDPITATVEVVSNTVNESLQNSRGWTKSSSENDTTTWTKQFAFNTPNIDISNDWDSESITGLTDQVCGGLNKQTGKFKSETDHFQPEYASKTVTITVQLCANPDDTSDPDWDLSFPSSDSSGYSPTFPQSAGTYKAPDGWTVQETKIMRKPNEWTTSYGEYYKSVSATKTVPYGTTLNQIEEEFKTDILVSSTYGTPSYSHCFYHTKDGGEYATINAPDYLTSFLGFNSEVTEFTKDTIIYPKTNVYDSTENTSGIYIYWSEDKQQHYDYYGNMATTGSPINCSNTEYATYWYSQSGNNNYPINTPVSDISDYLKGENEVVLANPADYASKSSSKFYLYKTDWNQSGGVDQTYVFDGVYNESGSDYIDSSEVTLLPKWKERRKVAYQLSDNESFTDTNWMPQGWTYDSTNQCAYTYADVGSNLFDCAQVWTSQVVINGTVQKYVTNSSATNQTSICSNLEGGSIIGEIESGTDTIVLTSKWSSTEPEQVKVNFKVKDGQTHLGSVSTSAITVANGSSYVIDGGSVQILDGTLHTIDATPKDETMVAQFSAEGITEEGKITADATFTASFAPAEYEASLYTNGQFTISSVPDGWTEVKDGDTIIGATKTYIKGTPFSEIAACWTSDNVSKIGYSFANVTPNTGKIGKDTNLSALWNERSYLVTVTRNDDTEHILKVPSGWTATYDAADPTKIISASKTYYGPTSGNAISGEWDQYDIVKNDQVFNGLKPAVEYLTEDTTVFTPTFESAVLITVHFKTDETVTKVPDGWYVTYYSDNPSKIEYAYKSFPQGSSGWQEEWSANNVCKGIDIYSGMVSVPEQVYYEPSWTTAYYAIIDKNEGESYTGSLSNGWEYTDGVCRKRFEAGTKYSAISSNWSSACSYAKTGYYCSGLTDSSETELTADTHFSSTWAQLQFTVTISQRYDILGSTTVKTYPEGWTPSSDAHSCFKTYIYGTSLSTIADEWNNIAQNSIENPYYNSWSVSASGELTSSKNIYWVWSDIKEAKAKLNLGEFSGTAEQYVSAPEGWTYDSGNNCYYSNSELPYDTDVSTIQKDWPALSSYVTCGNNIFTGIEPTTTSSKFLGLDFECKWTLAIKVTVALSNTAEPYLESFNEANIPQNWTLADDKLSAYRYYPVGYDIYTLTEEWGSDNYIYSGTNYMFCGFDTKSGVLSEDITLHTQCSKSASVTVDAGENNTITQAPASWAVSQDKRYATKAYSLKDTVYCEDVCNEWGSNVTLTSYDKDYQYDCVEASDPEQTVLAEGANAFGVKWQLVKYRATLQTDADTTCKNIPDGWTKDEDNNSYYKDFSKYTAYGDIVGEWSDPSSRITKKGYTFDSLTYEGTSETQLTGVFTFEPKFNINYYTATVSIVSGESVTTVPEGWAQSGSTYTKLYAYNTQRSDIVAEWAGCIAKEGYDFMGLTPASGLFQGNTVFTPSWKEIEQP